jgi:hypothetical protein
MFMADNPGQESMFDEKTKGRHSRDTVILMRCLVFNSTFFKEAYYSTMFNLYFFSNNRINIKLYSNFLDTMLKEKTVIIMAL